jgi:CRISPR-associated endonuclease Cas2
MSKRKEQTIDILLELFYYAKRNISKYSIKNAFLNEYYEGIAREMRERDKIRKEKRKIQNALNYLQRMEFLTINKNSGEIKFLPKGSIRAILTRSKKISKKRNGNYFYLVIFDIPEKMRRIRNLFRRVLYNFGSDRIQKSVFIIESEEGYLLVKDLVKKSGVDEYVKIIKCLKIEK